MLVHAWNSFCALGFRAYLSVWREGGALCVERLVVFVKNLSASILEPPKMCVHLCSKFKETLVYSIVPAVCWTENCFHCFIHLFIIEKWIDSQPWHGFAFCQSTSGFWWFRFNSFEEIWTSNNTTGNKCNYNRAPGKYSRKFMHPTALIDGESLIFDQW